MVDITHRLRNIWSRIWLRRVMFAGRYDRLDGLYRMPDPWNLSSPKEQARFGWTNDMILQRIGRPDSVLELGCGEGHHSEWLARIAGTLTGLEISDRAARRARKRVAAADIRVGRAEDAAALFADRRFDCIVACEVLYYSADIPGIIASLQDIGDAIFVSNYQARAIAMRHHFTGSGWSRLPDFESGGIIWEAHFWRRPVA